MDDKIRLMSKLDEVGMIDNVDSEMVPLDGTKMNVQEPIVVLGIDGKAGLLKESEMVCGEKEKKESDMEEVGDEDDTEEEVKNDNNPEKEARNDENNEDDPEEEVRNDDDPKGEVNIEENNEEVPEEVKNDENPKEEADIEENDEEDPDEVVKNKEDVRNDARNKGKLEAVSKKKVSKLSKIPKMLKKKKIALRKRVKNALVSTSKLDDDGWVGSVDTEMISLPMLDKNNTCNDGGTGLGASEKNDIVDNVEAISNQVKMNGEESYVILGDEKKKDHEIGDMHNEENTPKELQNEGDTRNEAKAKEKMDANSPKKVNKVGKKKKALRGKTEVVVNNKENSESSKKKTTMKDKCMGMIFMCSSKTKKDCYHYQVLGLPASKRDLVFEIYEGMKLFLFDVDLKLIYGIYEAAGPGGYNIEPKAFNSAFPSQVRFSVLEDCLPVAEEKFKKIIKDNYYSKNKFDCQLNSKQVENLCELFRVASKGSTYKQLNGSQQAEVPLFLDHGPKRPPRGRKPKGLRAEAPAFVDRESERARRRRKAERQQAEAPRPVNRDPKGPRGNRKLKIPRAEAPRVLDGRAKRPRRSRKDEARLFMDPKPKRLRRSPREETQNFLYGDSRHHGWEDERHRTLASDHLYPEDPVAYRREVYETPLEHPPPRQPLHLPLASSLPHSSERDVYRWDQVQYGNVRPLDVDLKRRDEVDRGDSYVNPRHRYDFNHHGSYLANRGHLSYLDSSSSAAQPSEYYPSAAQPSEYYASTARPSEYYPSAAQPSEYYPSASRRPASTYHLSAAPPPVYQPYRPAYRF